MNGQGRRGKTAGDDTPSCYSYAATEEASSCTTSRSSSRKGTTRGRSPGSLSNSDAPDKVQRVADDSPKVFKDCYKPGQSNRITTDASGRPPRMASSSSSGARASGRSAAPRMPVRQKCKTKADGVRPERRTAVNRRIPGDLTPPGARRRQVSPDSCWKREHIPEPVNGRIVQPDETVKNLEAQVGHVKEKAKLFEEETKLQLLREKHGWPNKWKL